MVLSTKCDIAFAVPNNVLRHQVDASSSESNNCQENSFFRQILERRVLETMSEQSCQAELLVYTEQTDSAEHDLDCIFEAEHMRLDKMSVFAISHPVLFL